MQNRRHEEIRRGRLDRAKEVVAAHISRVCGHMSAEELDVLVTRMANIDVKYSMRRSQDFFDPPLNPPIDTPEVEDSTQREG